MAIYSETLTASRQATTAKQFSGLLVVGLHGLDNGAASLQRSPDGSTWYDVRVYTDDGEYSFEAPGGSELDYYRIFILSKPRAGNILVRLGNGGPIVPYGAGLAVRTDDVGSGVTYVGEAAPGAATSASVWRVRRVTSTEDTILEWADGDSAFDNVWDNRASLTYL